jgi:hypothetical protein
MLVQLQLEKRCFQAGQPGAKCTEYNGISQDITPGGYLFGQKDISGPKRLVRLGMWGQIDILEYISRCLSSFGQKDIQEY